MVTTLHAFITKVVERRTNCIILIESLHINESCVDFGDTQFLKGNIHFSQFFYQAPREDAFI